MSEFGVSDSPCNISTKSECGVNLHYVKVGLSRRVREGPSVVLGGYILRTPPQFFVWDCICISGRLGVHTSLDV